MLKLTLISLFAMTSVMAANVNKVCPNKEVAEKAIDDLAKDSWFEIYASQTDPDVQCTFVMFEKKETNITVHHEGKKGDKKTPTHLTGNIKETFNNLYTINQKANTYQSVVLFKNTSYAVIHECTNAGAAASNNSFFILGRKPTLSLMEFVEINSKLIIDLPDFYKPEELLITDHYDKKCNSGTTTQVLTGLIVACLAVIKLF